MHLLDQRRGLLASAPAARGGNDAEGTAVLATVLDLDEGARSTGDSSHGHRRNLAGLGDGSHPHVGLLPLRERGKQIGKPVLLLVAHHEVDARHAGESIRIRLGETSRGHDQRGGIGPDDAPYGLAVGEVGPARHRAGIDDVDLGRLAGVDGAIARLLDEGPHLLRLDLVQPAAEGGEGDGRPAAHTVTTSLSCPQAAPMSSPLLQRTVVRMPSSRRSDWKARMRWRGGRWKPEPSQSLKGIRLTLARMPLRSRTRRRASSAESFTRPRSTYSNGMRWRKATGN